MSKYVYPFFKASDGVQRPWVPVRITNLKTGKFIDMMSLLDTGADKCVFPQVIAESCGLDLKVDAIREEEMQGVAKDKIPTWVHSFRIDLVSPDRRSIVCKGKETEVGCVGHNNMPVILGFANFMCNFKITFNHYTKKIIIDDKPDI